MNPNQVNDVSMGSSPASIQDTVVPGIPSSGSLSNAPGSQYVPYDRFAEVNREKRELEARLREFENSNSGRSTPTQTQQDLEKITYRQYLGLDQDKQETIRIAEERATRIAEEAARRVQQEATLTQKLQELQKRYDGQDGIIPAFDPKTVLSYAAERGIFDPESAFRDMNFDKFAEKKAQELAGATKSTYVESPTTASTSFNTMTLEEFSQLSEEEMEKHLPHK